MPGGGGNISVRGTSGERVFFVLSFLFFFHSTVYSVKKGDYCIRPLSSTSG